VIWGLACLVPICFYRTFTSSLSLMLIYLFALGVVFYGLGMLDPCESDALVEKLLSGATIEEVNGPASIFEEVEKPIDAVPVDGAWRQWIEKLILEPLEAATQNLTESLVHGDDAPECRG
jgi:hypothetical protein